MFGLTPLQIALLLGCGVAAGFINVVAGGGSLLTMPLLIFLGIPESAANGTARIAIAVQNVSAVARYHAAGKLPLAALRRLAPPAMLGGLLGSLVALQLGDLGFRALLGWVMLGCGLLVVLSPRMGHAEGEPPEAPRLGLGRVWLVGLAIGLYGGVVQAGVGYLILFSLTRVLRMSLFEANVLKVALVLAYTPIALLVFGSQGLLWLVPAVCLSVGQAAGGYLGASLSLARGAGLIRGMLAIVVLASALRLLGLW